MVNVEVKYEEFASGDSLTLRPTDNLITGQKAFEQEFGPPTTLESDLMVLASAIFAADLAVKRGDRENITRHIKLTVPVVNAAKFQNVRDDIRYILYVLSHDAWDVDFVNHEGTPERFLKRIRSGDKTVLLFSGGLDSFSAAVDLGERGESCYLVSHVTGNQVISRAQETLRAYLDKSFPDVFRKAVFRVGGKSVPSKGLPFPTDREREDTQRSRSFMFLSLAGLVARRIGTGKIVMIAENGQMAIHLPLTAARISAFSTHTAHPEFIELMSQFLTNVLSFPISIMNPFLYLTKGEVVRKLLPKHASILQETVSCWMSSRLFGNAKHCGACVPCLIRRISLENNGVSINEYDRDLFRSRLEILEPSDDGKRNFVELLEFVKRFEMSDSQASIEMDYPELASKFFDSQKTVAMYKRFAAEARRVLNKYKSIRDLSR